MLMLKTNSLVLYKNRPARVLNLGDRLEIELEGKETARVRPKDVQVLHTGPVLSLADLRPVQGDVQTAWEILAGGKTNLPELAELIYGEFTPSAAWATWQMLTDGLYFTGTPEEIRAYTSEEFERKRSERAQAEAQQAAWRAFLERMRKGIVDPSDRGYIQEIENLGLGRTNRSQVLRELGRAETPEAAHAFLLDLGVWDNLKDPYPVREGLVLQQPDTPVPALPVEDRLDLTHLLAYAIDDEWTDTPDDALSLDGERVWVHVADVAALADPGSPLDLEARSRGSSLHIPEGTVHLLPWAVTDCLGLGLQVVSPALSFGIDLDEQGDVTGFQVVRSRIRVQRLSYAGAEQLIDQPPLRELYRKACLLRERRRENQAVMIDFPEIKLKLIGGQVEIQPVLPFRSRTLVEEWMICTSAEAANFAILNGIPLPFSQQDALENNQRPETLSGMFGLRRYLKRSFYRASPSPHHGLGLPAYAQVTSPLRRSLDLVCHQQLRAFLAGRKMLGEGEITERIGEAEAILGSVRQAELRSEQHWTLVYLQQHPGWRGEGILVEKRGASGTLIIPELALEPRVHLSRDWPLDQVLSVMLNGINLPQLEVSFRVEDMQ